MSYNTDVHRFPCYSVAVPKKDSNLFLFAFYFWRDIIDVGEIKQWILSDCY